MNLSKQRKERLQKLLASIEIQKGHALIRVIGGLTRYRILTILDSHPSGLTVSDLADLLGASSSQVSHQISILKAHGLVDRHPSGRTVIYRVDTKKVKPFL